MSEQDYRNLPVKDLSFINDIKSMAVIGTSKKRNFFFLRSHAESFKGNVYAVNPTVKDIPGFDNNNIYSSLKDIPDQVDFVFIAVHHNRILQVIDDCVEKGVKLASIFTAEFSDSGTEKGELLEKELIKRADNKIRFLGPNGLGIFHPKLGIAWRKKFPTEVGDIAFLAQSGGLCNLVIYGSEERGVYLSKAFSFGNGTDLDFVDLLAYLSEDPDTNLILSYLEGIKDGRGKDLKKILEYNKKPIVIVKGGQTKSGATAAKTHTASISGDYQMWKAIFEQNNIIVVNSLEELISTAYIFNIYGFFELQNIAVLTSSGGYGVIISDIIAKHGIAIPQFSTEIQQKIDSLYYALGTSSKNPLDVSAQIFNSDIIYKIIDQVLSDEKIDGLIVDLPSFIFNRELTIGDMDNYEDNILEALTLGHKHNKPLFTIIPHVGYQEDRQRVYSKLVEKRVPVFCNPIELIPLLPKISNYKRKTKTK